MFYTGGMSQDQDVDFITLDEAARRAGYANSTTLRTAARAGRLTAKRFGGHGWLTTQAWLDEYIQSKRGGAYGRGEKRGPRQSDGDS